MKKAGKKRYTYSMKIVVSYMEHMKYVYWQDEKEWLGYFVEYPDYMTQGHSLDELKTHLADLYADLTGGEIPHIRHVAELEVGHLGTNFRCL